MQHRQLRGHEGCIAAGMIISLPGTPPMLAEEEASGGHAAKSSCGVVLSTLTTRKLEIARQATFGGIMRRKGEIVLFKYNHAQSLQRPQATVVAISGTDALWFFLGPGKPSAFSRECLFGCWVEVRCTRLGGPDCGGQEVNPH